MCRRSIRRPALKRVCRLLAVMLAAWSFRGRVPAADAPVRPNILWIVADDMSPHMSCYGEATIQTPHIDRLAAQGARFDRAFTTAPVCSPSRSALITGMYQTTVGVHNHRSSRGTVRITLPESIKPLPVSFQQAGYYTVLGTKLAIRKTAPAGMFGKSDYNFVWHEDMYDSDNWSGRRLGQPFFAQIQLSGGKNRTAKVPQPVDPARVKLPPYYPDHPVLRRDWADYLNAVVNIDLEIGQILKRLDDEGIADSTAVFFLADHGISHVRDKQFLYEGGIRIPLVVRWPGHVPGGTVRNDLVSHIDVAATSLRMAGLKVPAGMEGRPLFDPDHKPRDYVVAARDRCDETVDRIRCVRDERFKYIRNYYPERSHAQRNNYKESKLIMKTMRQLNAEGKLDAAQGRVFLPTRPAEELYDLQADPHELNNLADSPRHQDALKRMRSRLEDWIRTTGDQGQTPESAESLKAAKIAGHGDSREKRP